MAGAAPAAAAVLASTQALAPAAAFEGLGFDGPRGHQQFVLIDADGAPVWRADMWLYDGIKEIYHWDSGLKSGGKVVWWYTAGSTARVHLKIDSEGFLTPSLDTWIDPNGPAGHCANIEEWGTIEGWTGTDWDPWAPPSLQPSTQGCTPD